MLRHGSRGLSGRTLLSAAFDLDFMYCQTHSDLSGSGQLQFP
jgi:hypothetical protein